jgi:predicted Zn-ribbon and HTH transcriptional regulator
MTKKVKMDVIKDEANEASLEKFISNVDQEKVNSIKKDLEEYKKSLKGKEYAVSMTPRLLDRFFTYMRDEVQWRSKEALGVKEILKSIEKSKKEGIKDDVIYLTNLEIEASHYFILKMEGKGSSEVDNFVSLWKTFEESLVLVQQDNIVVKDLEEQLAAAEQGLELE